MLQIKGLQGDVVCLADQVPKCGGGGLRGLSQWVLFIGWSTKIRPLVFTRNYAYFCTYTANYELRASRKSHLRDHPMSTAVHRSPNKLWRSNSIFNLWMHWYMQAPFCNAAVAESTGRHQWSDKKSLIDSIRIPENAGGWSWPAWVPPWWDPPRSGPRTEGATVPQKTRQ